LEARDPFQLGAELGGLTTGNVDLASVKGVSAVAEQSECNQLGSGEEKVGMLHAVERRVAESFQTPAHEKG
jgi:hypothetical protein